MIHNKLICPLIFSILVVSSCKDDKGDSLKVKIPFPAKMINNGSLQERLNKNIVFIADSLLSGKLSLLKNYIQKYQKDSCGIVAYEDTILKSEFEGVKDLRDINSDGIPDSTYVIPPFNFCDDGDSYLFSDTSLPRLITGSYCCHPDNLFVVGDIDEDGIYEIGLYYSTCISHYKSLLVYSLKNGAWKEIGHCVYDLNYMNIGKPYSYFVRKLRKNKFEMLEITDLTKDKTKIGKRNWKKFTME